VQLKQDITFGRLRALFGYSISSITSDGKAASRLAAFRRSPNERNWNMAEFATEGKEGFYLSIDWKKRRFRGVGMFQKNFQA
jgi:hypothetical protein